MVVALMPLACAPAPIPVDPALTAYTSGQVWDGAAFVARDLYVRNEAIVDAPVGGVEGAGTVVELGGGYVVPPFTEAHHHVTGADDATSQRFLRDGVYYALNANTVVGPFEDRGDFFDRPDTYDVVLAMGGLTEPGGHPERLYVETLSRWVYQGWTLDDFLGDAFHYARTPEELESALDLLQSQGSQIVKTYLLYSEEYQKRRDDKAFYGAKGLNPETYGDLVEAIHARGLRVAVHVETDYDARVAAEAGVDLFVHLPAYYALDEQPERYRLSEATVEAIRASGAVAIATYTVGKSRHERRAAETEDPEALATLEAERDAHYAVQADNIQRLQAAGVPMAIGTDGLSTSPIDEALHLVEIGGLTATEALVALTQGGPVLFPDRRLGCLDPGCEADFLVVERDPTADLGAVREQRLRIKAGRALELPEPEPTPAPGSETPETESAAHASH